MLVCMQVAEEGGGLVHAPRQDVALFWVIASLRALPCLPRLSGLGRKPRRGASCAPQTCLTDVLAALDTHQQDADIQTKAMVLLGVLVQVRGRAPGTARNGG